MPGGVYPRRPAQLRAAKAYLAKGHTPEARARAAVSIRRIAQTPEWRHRVSEATQAAMRRPVVRRRHLKGLAARLKASGPNWRGGNGQPPTPQAAMAAALLKPIGFVPEYPIRTRGHGTSHRPPRHYKADFANPATKTVVELDGPSHRPKQKRLADQRKTEILIALGWQGIRVAHGKEVMPSHLAAVLP